MRAISEYQSLRVGRTTDLRSGEQLLSGMVFKTGIGETRASGFSDEIRERETAEAKTLQIPHWKRVLDITLVLITLPIWLSLMIIAALWVRLSSPGPIIFRQERVGHGRKTFMIFKFRSMKLNVETESHERHFERLMQTNCPMVKLDACGDPRLIPLGRILRASSLDELPQIFNVIRGEMSLVGPRPCTLPEFERYKEWQKARVNVPPGLTGYWQVHGKNNTTFSEMIEMDIYYGRNMSAGMDLGIILKTIPAIAAQFLESRIRSRAGAAAQTSVAA